MTEQPNCGRVQIDSHRKCQSFVVKVKKNEFDKVSTKIDGAVQFFANNLHLTIRNYLGNSFFIICQKMWLMGICCTVFHNFGDSLINDMGVW